MVIPRIIYRMSERASELTAKIIVTADSEKLTQFLSLINMPSNQLSKITDYVTDLPPYYRPTAVRVFPAFSTYSLGVRPPSELWGLPSL